MAVLVGIPIVYGCPDKPLPVCGFPDGSKVRLRFRPDDFAKAFVKHNGIISGYYITEVDGYYKPEIMFASNCVSDNTPIRQLKIEKRVRRLER